MADSMNSSEIDVSEETRKIFDQLRKAPIRDIPTIVDRFYALLHKNNNNSVDKNQHLRQLCEFFNNLDDDQQKPSMKESDKKELKEVEGNVIMQIMLAVKQNQDVGRTLVNIFKTHSRLIFKSFNAALLLSISQIKRYNEQILELFKTSFTNVLKEQEKLRNFAWLRAKLLNDVDIDLILNRLIEDCSCGWDFVLEGLRELGFAFLETHLIKVSIVNGKILADSANKIAHSACRWGETIVLECFKKHYSVRSSLICQVMESIFLQTSSALYYVELLSQFVVFNLQAVLECKQKISELFQKLDLLSSNVAVPFLKSLAPVLKLKPDMREKLVDVLKRLMFDKEIEARKTAVGGFLLFLRYFQIMQIFGANSQSQSQTFPTFSSQALTGSANNDPQKFHYEKLCLEVVCCLRKALSHQGEVRKMLYMGLCGAARRNKQILPPVIDLLTKQLDSYVEQDETKSQPPLDLCKCLACSKTGVVLMEPLGRLLQALNVCLTLTADSPGLNFADSSQCTQSSKDVAPKVKRFLLNLAQKFGRAELEDFKLDKSADYSTDSIEGAKNSLLAFELLSIFEALIEFCLSIDEFLPDLILELQSNHVKLSDVLKEKCVTNPGKKSMAAKSAHENEDTVGAQTFSYKKHYDIVTVRLTSLVDFLTRLLCDRNEQELTNLRHNVEFLRWIFNLCHLSVQNFKDSPYETVKPFETLKKLAKLLFLLYTQDQSIVDDMKRLRVSSFLTEKALDIVGCVTDIVCSRLKDDIESYLAAFDIDQAYTNEQFVDKVFNTIRIFIKILIRLLTAGNQNDEESEDKKQPKLIFCVIKILESFLKFLPQNSSQFEQTYNSTLQICENQPIAETNVAKALWSLLIRMQLEIDENPRKLLFIAQNLLKIYGDSSEDEVAKPNVIYASINSKTANTILNLLLTNGVDFVCDDVIYLITKMKLNVAALKGELVLSQDAEKSEADCCDLLALILSIFQDLLRSSIPANFTDYLIKSAHKFYTTLIKLVQYKLFLHQKKLEKHLNCPKFEKLAKRTGTHFTPLVYKFLSYVEEIASAQRKRASTSTAAKTKAIREMKFVSQLIFAVEQYEAQLIQLGAKCKIDFMQGARPSTNRDYRIDMDKVKRVFEGQEAEEDQRDTSQLSVVGVVGVAPKRKRKSENDKQQQPDKPVRKQKRKLLANNDP